MFLLPKGRNFYGLINLRGTIISIMDMRVKLNFSDCQHEDGKTCVIIVTFDEFTLGFIVDDISSVINLKTDEIEKHFQIDSGVNKEYLSGVARTTDRKLILLLDIKKVLNFVELKIMQESLSIN